MKIPPIVSTIYGVIATLMALVFVIPDFANCAWNDYRLAHFGAKGVATITALVPENHSAVDYQFTYRGKMYQGEEILIHDLHPGESVPVTFLPRDPSLSVVSNPGSDEHHCVASIVVILTVIAGAWFIGTLPAPVKKLLQPPFRTRGGR